MKVTLIQPRTGRHNPAYIHEPLGLGYLAGYLKAKGILDVKIIVSSFFREDREIIDRCRDSDMVGFTATSPMMKHALFLAQEIKAVNPGTAVVFGGAHPSAEVEHTLAQPVVDFVVHGEGEESLHELVRGLMEGRPAFPIPGVSARLGTGRIVRGGDRKPIRNLDEIPFPDRELFDQERFLRMGFEKYGDRGAWVVSSRGCPYACTYCASHRIWTRQWRARSPENILGEIKQIKERFKADRVNFADDTFTVSRDRVAAFCRLLIEENIGMPWACNARVDTVDGELFELMRQAGCVEVWMGVESGDPGILREIKKKIEPPRIVRAFRLAKAAGLRTRGYFMIGARSESLDTIGRTERLIDTIEPDRLAFTVMTPYPGSEEYDLWSKSNGDGQIDWSEVDLLESETALLATRFLSKEQIHSEHQRLKAKYARLWPP
jgi:anaerobic magnesium-protoporphyrin IX monomethyl ester cyclase